MIMRPRNERRQPITERRESKMGLLSSILKRQSGVDIGQNGNSAPIAGDKADLALRFLDHVMSAWDLLVEARRRQEASAVAEETDKKVN
jgi:hypothetical protein